VAVAEWKGTIVFLRQVVPGAAPRSYGVEVAALAGVPSGVVGRAREILQRLEGGEGPVAPRPSPRTEQLALFAPPDAQLRREVAAIDPDRLTPMDALAALARLVDRARNGP
jgi:DNA mismatch repair protein MutS